MKNEKMIYPIKVYDAEDNLVSTSLAYSWEELEERAFNLCGTLPLDWTVKGSCSEMPGGITRKFGFRKSNNFISRF